MVWSSIDKSYQYPEHSGPSERDIDADLCVYTINLNGNDMDILVGLCDAETVPGINTYPLYVTTDTKSFVKIGLFEISSNQSRACIDDMGDVDISRLGNPLLFHDAQKHIRAARPVKVKVEKDQIDGKDETPDSKHPKSTQLIKINMDRLKTKLQSVPIQSLKLYEREKVDSLHVKTYKARRRNLRLTKRRRNLGNRGWFPKRIQSMALKQVVGEKNDDLLDCVISALNTVTLKEKPADPLQTRIAFAESIVASHGDHFGDLSVIAESNERVAAGIKLRMDKLSEENESLRLRTVPDMRLAKELIDQGAKNKLGFERLKAGMETLDRMAVRVGISDFGSIDNLMDDITSHGVPVNVSFLSMMEESFGIRLVVFVRDEKSEVGYWVAMTSDSDHIGTNITSITSIPNPPSASTPRVYVAMDTKHCQVISYKNNMVFTEATAPWAIRMATTVNSPTVDDVHNIPASILVSSARYTCSADVGDEIPGFGVGEYVDPDTYVDVPEESVDKLMSAVTTSTTTSSTAPNLNSHISLYMSKSWRSKLSDEWMVDIRHGGYVWGSVAHYLAAVPYREYPEYFVIFSKKSGSEVSKDTKLLVHHLASIPRGIDAGAEASEEEKHSIYEAKFAQHPSLQDPLRLTGRATLMSFVGSTSPGTPRKLVPNIALMRVREKLSR
jgi:hypothetical protein